MKKLSKKAELDLCWKNCLSMWRWIAKEVKNDHWLVVSCLKERWLENHGFDENLIPSLCFFCQYDSKRGDICKKCPGHLVDKEFDCRNEDYHYADKPIAFYNKLVSLNRKRLKARAK